jgi:hypothetical protein
MTHTDTQESRQSNYTGISDIIRQGKLKQEQRRSGLLVRLLEKKVSRESVQRKTFGLTRWKAFIRELEMYAVKFQLKRLTNEVEKLKF